MAGAVLWLATPVILIVVGIAQLRATAADGGGRRYGPPS
jgi:hypothetical protein